MPDFLSLDELKGRLHMQGIDDDDVTLQGYLSAAQSYLADPENGILRRPVVAQDFTEVFDSFGCVDLGFPEDARSLVVSYPDADGATQTLGSIYTLRRGQLVLNAGASWPYTRGPVTVSYRAGWDSDEIPQGVREVGYFIARTYYEQGDEMDADRFRSVVSFMVRGFRRATI